MCLVRSVVHWCAACGADHSAGSGGDDPVCADCGTSSVLAARPRSPLGAVHRFGVRRRPGLCVAEDGDAHTFVLPDGSTRRRRAAGRAEWLVLDGDLARLRSGPGVLFAHAFAAAAGDPRVPWPAEMLRDTASAAARADLDLARRAALDLLDLGAAYLLPELGLPAREWRWLAAVDAARRHDTVALVDHVTALPLGRFRGAVTLLAARRDELRALDDAGVRLRPVLEAWAAREPLAGVLARALGVAAAPDELSRVDDLLLRARRLFEAMGDEDLAAQVRGVAASGPHPPPDRLGPRSRALVALRAPEQHPDVLRAGDLAELDTPVLEDAVAAGMLDVDRLRGGLADDPRQAALIAELDPAALSTDELGADPDEAARRALRDGREPVDDVALGARGRHVAALAAVRAGRFAQVRPEDVLAGRRGDVERLCTAARLASEGSRHHVAAVVGPDLLADRTVWPILDELLGDRPADDGGSGHTAAFESWRALHRSRIELYAQHWSRAVGAARPALADADADPRIRAEALNLTACAVLHEDAPGACERAAQALDHALRMRPSTALRLNRALALTPASPEAAAACLVEVAEGPVSTALRRAVAFEALGLWRADRAAWAGGEDGRLPVTVRDLLRRAAVEDLTVDDFREVVVALARWDASWLADRSHLAASPHRETREARYHRALAAGDHGARVGVLAEVTDWSSAARWLADERDRLVRALVEALREDGRVDDVVAGRRAIDVAHRLREGLGERTRVELALLGLAALHHADRLGDDVDLAASVDLLHWARAGRATLGEDPDLGTVERLATDRIAWDVYNGLFEDYQRPLSQHKDDMRTLQRLWHTDADLRVQLTRVRGFIGEMNRIVRELGRWVDLVTDRRLAAAAAELLRAARDAGNRASDFISSGGGRW